MLYSCFLGNHFGEEGIELLRESIEAKGLVDALGSLSDDEGIDSEEEGEGEGEEGDDEIPEEEQAETSGPSHPPPELQPVSHLVEVAASS